MSSTLDEILLQTETTDKFITELMKSLLETTNISNSIPCGEGGADFEYFSTFPQFATESKESAARAAKQLKNICSVINPNIDFEVSKDLFDPSLFEQVVDVLDSLLEGADIKMDEVLEVKRDSRSIIRNTMNLDKEKIMSSNVRHDIPKPQLSFISDINNTRLVPFKPKITNKPNSIVPFVLKECPLEAREEDYIGPSYYFANPYETELKKLTYKPEQLESPRRVASTVSPPNSQPFHYIDTEDELYKLVDELQHPDVEEIAIDLEHHSHRSFQGFTCLMQLSTRFKNYVVDTIALRRQMSMLLPIFTNKDVVKVFHGCDSDILWLQRDFGLYVINCFDTFQAVKLLKYPSLSLAHLLKYHCGITVNKKFQLADWRVRPLSDEMISYARDDTHYLLYVYDKLRREVFQSHGAEGLLAVLDASKRTCGLRYEKEPFRPRGYTRLLGLESGGRSRPSSYSHGSYGGGGGALTLTTEQDLALAALWDWRDITARDLDESVAYIMSNSEMLRIARALPHSVEQLLQTCRPLSTVVVERASDIIQYMSLRLLSAPVSVTVTHGPETAMDVTRDTARVVTQEVSTISSSGSLGSAFASAASSTSSSTGSVYTFTPCISTPLKDTQERTLAVTSPVMETDEIYRMAGWRTPMPPDAIEVEIHRSDDRGSVLQPPAPILDKVTRPLLSVDTHRRLEIAVASLCSQDRDVVVNGYDRGQGGGGVGGGFHEGQESELGHVSESSGVSGAAVSGSVDDDITLMSVPRSLVEIYDISNRNRKQNKQRKQRLGGASSSSSGHLNEYGQEKDQEGEEEDDGYGCGDDAFLAGLGSAGVHNPTEMDVELDLSYLPARNSGGGAGNSAHQSKEAALDFLQQIGWLPSDPEERLSVLEEHLRQSSQGNQPSDSADLMDSSHRPEQSGGDGVGVVVGRTETKAEGSAKTKKTSVSSSTSSNTPGPRPQSGGSAAKRLVPPRGGSASGAGAPPNKYQNSSSGSEEVVNMNRIANKAMGALGGSNYTEESRGGNGGSIATKHAPSFVNPFLTQSRRGPGAGGRGGSGSSSLAQAHQAVEKREKDRTLTYSKSRNQNDV